MTPTTSISPNEALQELPRETGVAIVGAGFSGIAMGVKLRRAGREDYVVLEKGRDVGGTWRDNDYPGCACDVPSHVYSFSFAPNPSWSSTFSPQSEIHDYLRDVARREDVVPRTRFGCEVEEARWDDAAQRWVIRTPEGELRARTLIAAAGPFSEPVVPDVPGLDEFRGTVFHSSHWNHDHDLTGDRVAVVGTGASSIQFVPRIQPQVSRLHLFQRTAPWITPKRARSMTDLEHRLYRAAPAAQRLMRWAVATGRETFAIPMLKARRAELIRGVALRHLRRQVSDPELRRKLKPHYAPGCKRILISNDYYPSLQQPNVEVVTEGVVEVREGSVVGSDGSEREVDTIIFGTGFNVTEPPIAQRVIGRDGQSLAGRWAEEGMQAHRGTTVAGYPNLFFLLGPNTGLGHNSVMLMAEAQADYALQAIERLDREAIGAMEPRREAQDHWNASVQRLSEGTVWTSGGCASWYLDGHGRNTTIWPHFSTTFRRALRTFRPDEYIFDPPEKGEPAPSGVPEPARAATLA
jgi:cation diffusion facilitator CzcD-associated flavoprotein CzcO